MCSRRAILDSSARSGASAHAIDCNGVCLCGGGEWRGVLKACTSSQISSGHYQSQEYSPASMSAFFRNGCSRTSAAVSLSDGVSLVSDLSRSMTSVHSGGTSPLSRAAGSLFSFFQMTRSCDSAKSILSWALIKDSLSPEPPKTFASTTPKDQISPG